LKEMDYEPYKLIKINILKSKKPKKSSYF